MKTCSTLLAALVASAQLVLVSSGQRASHGASRGPDSATILRRLSAEPTNQALLGQLLQAIGAEKDSSEKARLTTIYGLGALLTGQSGQWRKASSFLRGQYPDSEWARLVSTEALAGLCPACNGVGYTYGDCKRCKSDGKCSSCKGKGYREVGRTKSKQACSLCKGSGKCTGCEGSGKAKLQCAKCRGRGLALSAEETRKVYLKLLRGSTGSQVAADASSRAATLKALAEKNTAEREREREYGLAFNSLDEQRLNVRLRVLKVLDDAILATGYCRTYALPQQFWVTGIKVGLVDGDRWQGDVYNVGRLSIATPDGVPYTFRVFSASKEEAARAIVGAPQEPSMAAAAPAAPPVAAPPSSGTGWFCKGGFIVTCYHVVHGHDKLSIVLPGAKQIPARLVQFDRANDIALLKCARLASTPLGLPIAKTAPAMGDKVFTIGFPHTDLMGKSAKLSNGVVSALTGFRDDPRTLQISVPVQSGNSGGPLFNEQGEVVGIVASKLAAAEVFRWTGDMPQNVNYAIKTGYLNPLLGAVPANNAVGVRQAMQAPLRDVAKDVAGAVVLVLGE